MGKPVPMHGTRLMVLEAVFAHGVPRKVLVSGCPELPADPRHLWAPLQEQSLGMASSSPSQAAGIHPSPRAHPAAPPLFPLPGPGFHQMLGLEDETALPTPGPAAALSSSHSRGWIRPRRLNKALPLSGSPRCASPYLAQPPCQEQAGGQAGEGEAFCSSPPPPNRQGPLSPLAKPPQHLSSTHACSPKWGHPPLLLSSAAQTTQLGTAASPPHPHPEAVQASPRGSQHPRGGTDEAGAGRGRGLRAAQSRAICLQSSARRN